MKYVLDSSVAVKWAIAEVDTECALRIRNEFNTGNDELIAPDFFPIEIVHALTRAERQGRIAREETSAFLIDLIHNLPDLHASLPLLPAAYERSSRWRIGVYDCVYLALAEREQCKMITADEKLAGQFPTETVLLSIF